MAADDNDTPRSGRPVTREPTTIIGSLFLLTAYRLILGGSGNHHRGVLQ
jgi:hypothetical protein